ncbi:hypothetical protein KC660_01685 [Candidatus Dojkabacteria bacterium]|uniref:Methyltransferase domain-containing protein n=1 Tax=Candidatus Dojkabacteria bacterium TaxID=2099670 RepID=A0A955L3A6_9BACT|nr:hypothetical protein [Candidatus Dojkabacteria bacterium]
MKKFRFQLLSEWIINNYNPCKVADIGGGKGLLSYLLNKNDFKSTVIDPFNQTLPEKYKDLQGKKHKVLPTETVPRINEEFRTEMANDFDLLVGLHAHGSNMKVIESAAKYRKQLILLPCCVINEPIIPKPNINWLDSLEEYAN